MLTLPRIRTFYPFCILFSSVYINVLLSSTVSYQQVFLTYKLQGQCSAYIISSFSQRRQLQFAQYHCNAVIMLALFRLVVSCVLISGKVTATQLNILVDPITGTACNFHIFQQLVAFHIYVLFCECYFVLSLSIVLSHTFHMICFARRLLVPFPHL